MKVVANLPRWARSSRWLDVITERRSTSLWVAIRHVWELQYTNTVLCSTSQLTLVKLLVTNNGW